jgi:hypothetical protein
MADNHGNHAGNTGGHPAMDYAEHEKTYKLFVQLTKWGIVSNVVILILMAIFLL